MSEDINELREKKFKMDLALLIGTTATEISPARVADITDDVLRIFIKSFDLIKK